MDEDNKSGEKLEKSEQSPLISIQVDETVEEGDGGTFNATVYEATRSIITRQIVQLEEIKHKMRIFTEQIQDMVENSEALSIAEKESKEASKKAKEIKTNILQSQAAKNLKMQVQELRDEQKDLVDSMSGHLLDLYQTTGVMEFEAPDGSVYEYKISAKLGGKKQG